eukprot:720058-Ditylum_brightwellii.AAC.1
MGLVIDEGTPNLQPQRENNLFIMEDFAMAGYEGAQLEELNRCRLHLKATTLFDITSGDGKTVLKRALEGTPSSTPPRYNWTHQPPPS